MYVDTLLRAQFGKPSGLWGTLVMRPILNLANMPLVDRTIELLDPQPKDVVLDIGFGGGYSLVTMAGKVPRGKVVGVDYSREMVDGAVRMIRAKSLDSRVRVQWGDVADLPFRAGSFHKVLTVNSLYYWPDLEAGLREIARVLKRHGRLAAGFRSPASLRPLTRDWEGFALYEPEEFAGILRETGFDVLRADHRGQWQVLDIVVVVGQRR